MVTHVAADKYVLKWARDRVKLSVPQAATLLKCKPELLQKIENGNAFPNATLFRRMSEIYFIPEATLLGSTTAEERPLPRDFRSFEGATVALSYETIATILRVQARQDALSYLAGIDDSVIPPNPPIYSLKEDPEKFGVGFRQQLGFPIIDQLRLTADQAFMRWRVLIEGMGISVYIEPLGEDGTRGVSIYSNEFPAIVVDQNEKIPGARSFTLIHELGHILVRQSGISNFNPRNRIERFCNHFAAAFLLPIEAIEAAFPRQVLESREPPISDLNAAATKLCVTISQIALRLEELGRAKTGFYNQVASTLSPSTPKKPGKGVPQYKYVYLSRYGHHLPNAVFGSLDRGAITTTEASRILELSPTHFAPIRQVMCERIEVHSEHLQ